MLLQFRKKLSELTRFTSKFLQKNCTTFSPNLEQAYLNRKTNMARSEKRERLLFYPFFTNDVDKILSNNFDARINGYDDLGGIPFSESPCLTIGHGNSSGLLLCRVLVTFLSKKL